MCGTCGCSDQEGGVTIRRPGDPDHIHHHQHSDGGHDHGSHSHGHGSHSHGHGSHSHNHGSHSHGHDHHHDEGQPAGHTHHDAGREIRVEQDILSRNNLLAERNRGYLEAKNITGLNFVSSPGAGKTTLLELTIRTLKADLDFYVIEGDQQSMNDADRIDATGVPVIQINTGSGCHLDASMVNRGLRQLDPASGSILLIENVGNLVCPALFDLGEHRTIVIISVTEGDDKPVKYPTIFRNADICIVNKIDLLPYVSFDVAKTREYAQRINPHLQFFETSATTGEGMEEWYEWLKAERTNSRS